MPPDVKSLAPMSTVPLMELILVTLSVPALEHQAKPMIQAFTVLPVLLVQSFETGRHADSRRLLDERRPHVHAHHPVSFTRAATASRRLGSSPSRRRDSGFHVESVIVPRLASLPDADQGKSLPYRSCASPRIDVPAR